MNLSSMTPEQLENNIRRIEQALGGGRTQASTPRKLSPREESDAKWRLERIAQEMNVLERPRSYELPPGAGAPAVTEGPLTDEEKRARPMGPEGVWTPQFGRETGNYIRDDGAVTNVGSRGKPAYQEDPNLAEDYERLQQEKRRLEQALAGHQEAMRRDTLAEQGKTPTARDYRETPEGVRDKIVGGAITEIIKGANKLSKADEATVEALVDRKAEIDKILDLGMIEEAGVQRPLTEAETRRLEATSARLQRKVDRLGGAGQPGTGTQEPGGAPQVAPGESIEVNGTVYLIPNLQREAQQNPDAWNKAVKSGRIPPEVAQAVQGGQGTPPPEQQPPEQRQPAQPPEEKKEATGEKPDEVQSMLQEIRAAKEAKDRPRLYQLRQQNPDAYKKAMKLYRKEGGTIPGSNLRIEGKSAEYDQAWEALSPEEQNKAVHYEQELGAETHVKDGKIYVRYMGRDFVIGPKGK
jgi:hypothetical protein